MKNFLKLISVLIILLFVVSYVVYAKGVESRTYTKSVGLGCSEIVQVEDRVKCKIEKEVGDISVLEACSVLSSGEDDCVTLHKRVYFCYEKNGKEKDQCFKDKAKFTHISLEKESEVNKESVRSYLLFLLYDLERIVEDAYDKNKISSDDASDLIVDIVKIKKDILTNANKDQIKEGVNRLKNKWKDLM